MDRGNRQNQRELDKWNKRRAYLTQLALWGGRPPLSVLKRQECDADPADSQKKRGPGELLKSHYANYFPFREICEWLTYGKPEDLCLREFAYTNWRKGFHRYQTYPEYSILKYWMHAITPVKLDIGAVCDREPRWAARETLQHVAREFTFDIDLSDYNDVRLCCKESDICKQCWNFAAVACKILHASFTEDFGWKHILWVFSGRRGVHCWICDDDARRLDDYERHRLLKYFLLPSKKHLKSPDHPRELIYLGEEAQLHPHIARSCKIATIHFIPVCINEMNILGTTKGAKYFISLLPDETTRQAVTELFAGCATGREKWKNFFHAYLKEPRTLPVDLKKNRPHFFKEIALHYLYPRIDAGVTEKLNHLLKSPFTFHPDTRKLCTPFDPSKVDEFDVSQVPIMWRLIPLAEERDARLQDGRPARDHFQLDAYDRSLRVFQDFLGSFEKKCKKNLSSS